MSDKRETTSVGDGEVNKDTVIRKSPSDKRLYRYIVLENGLKCCLISDPSMSEELDEDEVDHEEDNEAEEEEGNKEAGHKAENDAVDGDDHDDENEELGGGSSRGGKRAAAALSVGVGSFCDKPELQGMAHFVEHMLFMGSEKYKDENEFDAFVTKHGGYTNAFTDQEDTTYEFDVHRNYLKDALDMFAQFFVSPLMLADSMDRELKAIDSEFTMSQQNDYARLQQVVSGLAPKTHPINNFSWGDVRSLKSHPEANGVPVRDELYKFWETYYCAGRMNLCLVGQESLDELEEMVSEIFSHVPNRGGKKIEFSHLPQPWSQETSLQLLYVVPVNDVHSLRLTWILPPMFEHYKSKPLYYIAECVGHEGKGSILEQLKHEGLALGLSAGCSGQGDEINSNFFVFQCSIALTDKGVEPQNVAKVVSIVLKYFTMLKTEGPKKWLWQEMADVAAMGFRFAEEHDPTEYVEKIALDMHDYPAADILTGDILCDEWDPVPIKQTMDFMTNKHLMVSLLSSRYADKCTETEPWFKETKWGREDIPKDWLELWKSSCDPSKVDKTIFHLPTPNQFVPTNFDLLEVDENATKVPHIVHEVDGLLTTWHLPDADFRKPRCDVLIRLETPQAYSSAMSALMSELFIKTLDLKMKTVTYAASIAEMHYSLNLRREGLEIKVEGFSDKIEVLLTIILENMRDFEADAETLDMVQQEVIRNLKNSRLKPEGVGRSLRLETIDSHHWSAYERLEILSQFSPASLQTTLQSFVDKFWQGVHTTVFVHGNLSEDSAIVIGNKVVETLATTKLLSCMKPVTRVTKIPEGEHFVELNNPNPNDDNSYIECYYQFDGRSPHKFVLTELVQDMMAEPCFNELRTSQQLGYSVTCSYRQTHGHLGYLMTVQPQSSKFTLEDVNKRIEAFLSSFKEYLEKLPEADFMSQIESSVSEKMRPETNLSARTSRYWSEIETSELQFDRMENEAKILMSLKLQDVIEFYSSSIHPSAVRRKMGFRVKGKAEICIVSKDGAPTTLQTHDNQGATFKKEETGEIVFDVENFTDPILAFVQRQCVMAPAYQVLDPKRFVKKAKLNPENENA